MLNFPAKVKFAIVLTLFMVAFCHVYPCTCGRLGIEKEVDTAYDFIVGRVVGVAEDTLTCGENFVDYLYEVDVEFSYSGKFVGKSGIFGGRGGGACGAIFENGQEYLIVVRKCERGFYTYLCSDNQLTSNAASQIKFLNDYFGKNYQIREFRFLIPVAVLSFMALLAAGFVTFNYYKKNSRMNIRP